MRTEISLSSNAFGVDGRLRSNRGAPVAARRARMHQHRPEHDAV